MKAEVTVRVMHDSGKLVVDYTEQVSFRSQDGIPMLVSGDVSEAALRALRGIVDALGVIEP